MGDMLAALSQAGNNNGKHYSDNYDVGQTDARCKKQRWATACSQFDLAAGRRAADSNYNDLRDQDEQAEEVSYRPQHDEEQRRVPLLYENGSRHTNDDNHQCGRIEDVAPQKSRWRSCRLLDERRGEAGAGDVAGEHVCRATSKKSLAGSLFSHSNTNQSRNCDAAAVARRKGNTGRAKLHHHHHQREDELFVDLRAPTTPAGPVEALTSEKVKCLDFDADFEPANKRPPLVNKRSLNLLSLLSHDSLEFCPRLRVGAHQPSGDEWRANNREAASLAAEEDMMTSGGFSATGGDCCRPIEQQRHELNHRRHQQQAGASAIKLASSSPNLSSKTPTPTDDNYDATGDCSGSSSNKELRCCCDATQQVAAVATCNKQAVRLERRRRRRQLAVATRNGQVALTKLPRVERARAQRQAVESSRPIAALPRQSWRHHAASQGDSASRPTDTDSDADDGHHDESVAVPSALSRPSQPIGLQELAGVATIPVAPPSSFQCALSPSGQRRQQRAELRCPADERDLDWLELAAPSVEAGLEGNENAGAEEAARDKVGPAAERNIHTVGAKNNGRELSSGFGLGLASTKQPGQEAATTTTTTATTTAEPTNGDDHSGGQREADNHLGRVQADQLPAPPPLLQREQQQQQQRRRLSRPTVTNGIAQLACQLDAAEDNDDDDQRSSSWLVSAGAQDDRACGPSEVRWNGDGTESEDAGRSEAFGQRVEQIGGAGEGFSACEASPEQMSDQGRHQRKGGESSELNNSKSVATRLADTCASSWRQAALMASPVLSNLGGSAHTGSYKVAQQQQQQQHATSQQQFTGSNQSSQQTNQPGRDNNSATGNQYGASSGQEVRKEQACYNSKQAQQQQQGEQHQQQPQVPCKQQERNSRLVRPPVASQRRLSRPGRSPISLQRQTNARLARHRLKIQQQRQEQLASLALREREQSTRERCQLYNHQGQQQRPGAAVSTLASRVSPPPLSADNLEIEILPIEEARQQVRADRSSSFLGDLFARLSGGRRLRDDETTRHRRHHHHYNHHQRQQASLSGSGVALVDFGQQSRVAPRATRQSQPNQSVSIAICDNQQQLDSSRGRQTNTASQHNRTASFNMYQLSNATSGGGGNPNNARRPTSAQQGMASKRGSVDSSAYKTTAASSLSSAGSSASSSTNSSTLSLDKPFCKICHLSSTRNGSDKLISPCKCSGTMQYIHCGCLLKWLEISNRTNEKPISCELCSHEYTWHKRFNYQRMKLPKCSSKDILLHMIFVLAMGGMLFCALAPLFNRSVKSFSASSPSSSALPEVGSMSVEQAAQSFQRSREISFGGDHHHSGLTNRAPQNGPAAIGFSPGNSLRPPHGRAPQPGEGPAPTSPLSSSAAAQSAAGSGRLANDEKFILICAAFFFISFFIAIYAQTKTRDTLYGLIVKFTNMNLTYYITEYDHGNSSANNNTNTATATVASPTTATTTTTSLPTNAVTSDGNNESSDECDRDQFVDRNIGTSQHSNGGGATTNPNQKGRQAVVSKPLGQAHLFNNARKASA